MAARSRMNPYNPNAGQATSIHPLPLSSTSSSQPPSPSSPSQRTLREHYVRTCHLFYPHIQARHDWDIVVLGCRSFKDGDFHAHSDSCLEHHLKDFPPERVKDGSARRQLMREATEFLDMRDTPTGAKPLPGEDDVHIRPIPNSDYSFRLWGKGLESKREYCLDFVHSATGQPVNSPFKYELWVVPSMNAPSWLPGAGMSRIYSLERSFGIPQEDILPGAEKFVLLEGTACLLVRPGMRSVRFEVPIRSPPNRDIGDVDEITFS